MHQNKKKKKELWWKTWSDFILSTFQVNHFFLFNSPIPDRVCKWRTLAWEKIDCDCFRTFKAEILHRQWLYSNNEVYSRSKMRTVFQFLLVNFNLSIIPIKKRTRLINKCVQYIDLSMLYLFFRFIKMTTMKRGNLSAPLSNAK